MEQRLSVITLLVRDLAAARSFYLDGLGWRASPSGGDEITFVDAGGVVLGLYPREAFRNEVEVAAAGGATVTLAHNVLSREEVDTVLAEAEAAGGRIVKPAQEAFWGGYSGYVADPDDHLWEIVWNPFWSLDEAGRVVLPD
ncbi:MAG: VOC family protein [Alphaproteobacteria bacterium]|jgi:hypothetical protein|nr:VOC family protein [Alphaproteobacteria bacterium]